MVISTFSLLLWGIGTLIVLLAGIAWLVIKSKKDLKPDYLSLFIIGLIWTPMGVAMENLVLWIMGAIFAIFGLIHKKEWDNKSESLMEGNKKEKKLKKILIGILVFLLIVGTAVLVLLELKLFP